MTVSHRKRFYEVVKSEHFSFLYLFLSTGPWPNATVKYRECSTGGSKVQLQGLRCYNPERKLHDWRLVKIKQKTMNFRAKCSGWRELTWGKAAFLFVSSDGFVLKSAVRPFAACFYRISTHVVIIWVILSGLWHNIHTCDYTHTHGGRRGSNDVLCTRWLRVGRLVSCQRTLSLLKTSTWPRKSRRLDER